MYTYMSYIYIYIYIYTHTYHIYIYIYQHIHITDGCLATSEGSTDFVRFGSGVPLGPWRWLPWPRACSGVPLSQDDHMST